MWPERSNFRRPDEVGGLMSVCRSQTEEDKEERRDSRLNAVTGVCGWLEWCSGRAWRYEGMVFSRKHGLSCNGDLKVYRVSWDLDQIYEHCACYPRFCWLLHRAESVVAPCLVWVGTQNYSSCGGRDPFLSRETSTRRLLTLCHSNQCLKLRVHLLMIVHIVYNFSHFLTCTLLQDVEC